jgi:PAS domain-containing protein
LSSPNAAIIVAFFCGAVALFVVGLILQRVRYSRKQRESRMSEERYLQALEGSTDGLWDWDLQSDSVRYSDGFMKTLGVSSQEFPGDMAPCAADFIPRTPTPCVPPSKTT